jgi:hypothetical protein
VGLTNVWVRTLSDGLIRADHIDTEEPVGWPHLIADDDRGDRRG